MIGDGSLHPAYQTGEAIPGMVMSHAKFFMDNIPAGDCVVAIPNPSGRPDDQSWYVYDPDFKVTGSRWYKVSCIGTRGKTYEWVKAWYA